MSGLGERTTRAWVSTYTKRLPSELRHDRTAEIDSDLWEHRLEASARGASPRRTSIEMAHRVIAGVPADLAWRRTRLREQRRARSVPPTEGFAVPDLVPSRSGAPRWVSTLGALIGGTALLFGISGLLFGQDAVGWGIAMTTTGLLIVAGLLVRTRFPNFARCAFFAGGLTFALFTPWLVLTVVAGVALAIGAIKSSPPPLEASPTTGTPGSRS
jgi:hypothetical protein